jgi:branched-chain amino acid transport system substrate-binding protein
MKDLRTWLKDVAAAAALALGLAGGGYATAETLVVNDLESLSGVAMSVYVPQANAITLAVEQLNAQGGVKIGDTSYMIELRPHDDRSDTSAGVAAVQKILGHGSPSFILGGGTSSISAAYSPIVKNRTDVIVLATASLLPGLTENPSIYRPRIAISQYTSSIVSYITGNKAFKRVAMGVDNKNAGLVNETGKLAGGMKAGGVEIVAAEEWSSGASSFAAQISAMTRGNPDVILIRGYPADNARFVKQARELGYKGSIVSNSGMSAKDVNDAQAADAMADVVEIVAPVVSDLILGDRNKAVAQKFEDAYQAKYGQPSSLLSPSAYGAVFILARAIEKAGTATDVTKIKAALDDLKVTDVPEIVDPIKPSADGRIFTDRQSQFVTVVREWRDGKFQPKSFVE